MYIAPFLLQGEYMGRRRKKRIFRKARKKKFDFHFHVNLKLLRTAAVWSFKAGVACLLAFVSVWYFGQQVSMVGDSMKPVLYNGDVVLVNRIVYNATTPKRGDIIVFKPKGNENDHYFTKRIVGLPGESVEIIENRVYIDGEKLEEEYETTDIDDVGIADEKIQLAGSFLCWGITAPAVKTAETQMWRMLSGNIFMGKHGLSFLQGKILDL